jgi:hypothetical protein
MTIIGPGEERSVELRLIGRDDGLVEVHADNGQTALLLGTLARRDDGWWFTSKASANLDINGYHEAIGALRTLFQARALDLAQLLLAARG